MTRTNAGQLELRLSHAFGAEQFGTVSVWFYDSIISCYGGLTVENTAKAKLAALGVQDWDSKKYYYATYTTNGTVSTRAKNWHLFSITCTPTNHLIALDGNVIFEGTNDNIGFNKIMITTSGPGGSGSYYYDDLSITSLCLPMIVIEPQDQSVPIGANAAFSITALGEGQLGYQWQFNGTNLAGATGTSLTITNVQLENAGNYIVVVSNEYYSVTSRVATLAIIGPIITTQPQSQAVPLGTNAVFCVVATNQGILSYQWQFNDVNIGGATNAVLVITNAQPDVAGVIIV